MSMAHMLRDYRLLLQNLATNGYSLGPVRTYFRQTFVAPFAFIRHDVDRLVSRAVRMAEMEAELDVVSTYYFRSHRARLFPRRAIARIRGLGHEIGYHYETLVRAGGDMRRAMINFREELEALRCHAPVETVAAHGSPLARDSNMGLSGRFDLSELGILGEPSVDFDFTSLLYVTDTGGTFGSSRNVRDRVPGRQLFIPTAPGALGEVLRPAEEPLVLLNCHPERWPASLPGLLQAQITDSLVNTLKMVVAAFRGTAPDGRRRDA